MIERYLNFMQCKCGTIHYKIHRIRGIENAGKEIGGGELVGHSKLLTCVIVFI